MKNLQVLGKAVIGGALFLGLCACGDSLGGLSSTNRYVDSVTGEPCTPDLSTLSTSSDALTAEEESADATNGDNMDDENSGHVDCRGDGNSGEGDDVEGCTQSSSDDEPVDDGSSSDDDDGADDGADDEHDLNDGDAGDDAAPACDANGCCEAP